MSSAKVKICGVQQTKPGDIDLENGTIELNEKHHGLSEIEYDVPVFGTIYGAALNYKGAYEKLEPFMHEDPYKEPPKAPILYIKPINTLIGSNASIPLPKEVSQLEVGASLGVVIGKTATKVKDEEALEYVSGYTIVNDISVPIESAYRPAFKEKSRDGFCPIGPWIMERDEIHNPDELDIRVYINGELKQESNTKNLIRSVSKLLTDVTEFMTLYEGDTLLVGVPENAPHIQKNDHVRIEIDGIGSLENTLKDYNTIFGGDVR